jgi:hypothetical protein
MGATADAHVTEVPLAVQSQLEACAKTLRMDAGKWKLEVSFHDGRLELPLFRHERVTGTGLERFDRPE